MNISSITRAAHDVLHLIDQYQLGSAKRRELGVDAMILGYFQAKFGNMKRQFHLHIGKGSRPSRIDFRRGGTNPVMIEFACRLPNGVAELYGSQNRPELNKLTRIPQEKARTRVLLLLDQSANPIGKARLKATYDEVRSGRGKFKRHAVRVIYVHRTVQYHFIWKP